MPYVLEMSTLKRRAPVSVLILLETDDAPLHSYEPFAWFLR